MPPATPAPGAGSTGTAQQADLASLFGEGLAAAVNTLSRNLTRLADLLSGRFQSTLSNLSGALSGISGIFEGLGGRIGRFVETLNPAQMFQFGLALRDLQATIGSAFEGVIDVFIDLARNVAGALEPAMQALKPALTAIAQAFAAVLVPVVQVLAAVLQVVAPIIKFIGDVFQAFAPVVQAVAVVLSAFAQVVGSLLSSLNAGGFLQTIAGFFRKVAETIIVVMASVAKAFGATGFLDKLIANLEPEKGGQKAAIKGVGIQDFPAIARQMATLSAAAAGGGGVKKTEEQEWRDRVRKTLEDIRDNKATNRLIEVLEKLLEWLRGVKQGAKEAYEKVPEPLRKGAQAFNPFWGLF